MRTSTTCRDPLCRMFTDPAQERYFREGVQEFNERRFFNCHETLERIWCTAEGDFRLLLQGMIHAAVALHHLNNKNRIGAERQLEKSLSKLQRIDLKIFGRELGVNFIDWYLEIASLKKTLDEPHPALPKLRTLTNFCDAR
jgi:hypothetical protein